ncbi:MAG: sensor histidine kinase [Candidatus Devosia phytovorans]|uniref:histidine kinase n=1 Tax=Candidatus Devosia phytovorans TaxID=3121372 RepID=A0AAJ5VTL3_9HYPH|nr:sensor histidine kinase [Devosia sp.]WEK04107.1 MAG: sensor histidine kinase [Devosia sp.]
MTLTDTGKTQLKMGRRSIINYLVALVLVSVVPSFLFAGVLIQRYQAAQEDVVETLIVATSRSIVQAMEREILANVTTLRVLAASPSLREGDFRGFYIRTKLALEDTDANLFVVNPDFTTFASTRVPYDSPDSRASDIEAAQKAFDSNAVVVTDLVFGNVSKSWVYNILLPVDLGQYGKKLIALNQEAENFASALSANSLPAGWNTALLDNDGRILAASAGVGNVGDEFGAFDAMTQRFAIGWQSIETTDGAALGVIQRSGTTGWRLVAWAPIWTITQPLMTALLYLMAGGLILLGLIVAAMFWVSRRIGSSVRGLARDARRLGAGRPVTATPYPVAEIAEVSEALAQASTDRQAAENEVRFLMREVAHRSKNQMTVIAAMAKQTARGADDVESYVQAFERRILGLARSTDLLLTHGRAGVSLGELVESQIATFSPDDPKRIQLHGPEVRINAQAAQIIGMALHELSTNAVKYGAFAEDGGTLAVTWAVADGKLDFLWRETVAQKLETSDRVGFGTTVLKSMVGRSLGADVERNCHGNGIEWHFSIPLSAVDPFHAKHGETDEDDE